MSGSGKNLIIHPLDEFRKSVRKILRKHYKKDRKGAELFKQRIDEYVVVLLGNPEHPSSRHEPWPNSTYREGVQLKKLRFSLPNLRGAAGEGRLMYIVAPQEGMLILLCVYTHAEYQGRPPDRVLKELFAAAVP